MTDPAAVQAAIRRMAAERGITPALALAIAERESRFDPTAKASKTIRGIYQMRGDHRLKYGRDRADSADPYDQANAWGEFFPNVRKEMARPLGRDPTDEESYLGHHFGGVRAGRMLRMDPNTHVSEVFTPEEMTANPHFGKAGTVGKLNATITSDIARRMQKYSDGAGETLEAGNPLDFSQFGDLAPEQPAGSSMSAGKAAPLDFSQFGTPV